MCNSIHIASHFEKFSWQSSEGENVKLKCHEISTLQDSKIKMQWK